jgi:cellulose synthase operon protein C
MTRLSILALLALLAACASTIEGGPRIEEIAAKQDQPPPDAAGVQKSDPVRASAELALQNYEKLLSLPQEPAARAETMRRLADLNLQMDEQNPGTLEQSNARQRRSIELYNAVLTDFPTAPNNDRVLYQLSRAHQNLGESGKAEESLQRLIRDYPQSQYIDDAHFRRAEVLFKLGQFDDAALEYKHVLDLGAATPFFQPAQYKYGWAQYRQSNHEAALDVFMTILSRELPAGPLADVDAAVAGAGKKELVQDALRVVNLALTQLGGGEAAKKYFAARGEPPYVAMLYVNLGAHLLDKRRYTDAARAYGVFIEGHPRHELAPAFQTRAIEALNKGGFVDQVVEEKERYAQLFDPKADYWKGRNATPAVLAELRMHQEDLARHYQARGQRTLPHDPASARQDLNAAARWYRRLLEQYPQDPKAPEFRFLLAESLLDAGETMTAAAEYNKVVADYPGYGKAPEAAYAALLAYQRRSTEVPEAQRADAQRKSVAAALQLAERFPQHEAAVAALTRASEDLYLLKDWDRAVATAARVLGHEPPAAPELRRTALSVTGDTHYSQKRFDKAEAAYVELLGLLPPEAVEERAPIVERIAESIYKQGEAWRDAGKPAAAADTFLRVGARVPDSKIRAAADYDAAAMLILAKDWDRAATVLEAFRTTHATSGLLPDVDKKLAVVYQNAGKPRDAAVVLDRIKARETETADVRLEAAWLEVSLLDQARDPKAWPAYEAYLKQYPRPLDRAMEARQKLADYAATRKDAAKREALLREIIAADAGSGTARTPRSRQLAAEATLEFARAEAQKAAKVPLKLPLAQSVKLKKDAMERAIAELTKASDYNVAAVTTAATYELGVLYQQFGKSLMESERPRKLSALEREQYDLLLEEQAFPFEEKAIEWHEANLQRVTQGVYSEWIGRSLQALGQIAPGKYAKREQTAEAYDALR